jgi:hypothetical protein
LNILEEIHYFFGEYKEWWMCIDFDTRWNMTWEEFEKFFSYKWIRDKKWRCNNTHTKIIR